MSSTSTPPLSFYGPTPEGFPPLARLSVERYERMIDSGLFGDNDRFELIEGTLVQKMTKEPPHSSGSEATWRALHGTLPHGWHVRIAAPVRIPRRASMPEPDVSVARGSWADYSARDPGPEDLALVVEVSYATIRADRALARTYILGGIPLYWLVNVRDRQLEVYVAPAVPGRSAGTLKDAPAILAESETAELIIAGQSVARIPVAELLPPP